MANFSEKLSLTLFTFITLGLLAVSFLPEATYILLAQEDALFEDMTVFFCFLGAYFSMKLFFRRRKCLGQSNYFFLLLSLCFLFVAFEEISWGQRIIGFRPISVGGEEENYQREFNLHNLEHIDVFIYLGGFFLIVLAAGILPLLTYFFKRIKELCLKLGIPLMPRSLCLSIWLGFLFLVLIPQIQHSPDHLFNVRFSGMYGIRELREFYFSLIFCLYIFIDYFYLLKWQRAYQFKDISKAYGRS